MWGKVPPMEAVLQLCVFMCNQEQHPFTQTEILRVTHCTLGHGFYGIYSLKLKILQSVFFFFFVKCISPINRYYGEHPHKWSYYYILPTLFPFICLYI